MLTSQRLNSLPAIFIDRDDTLIANREITRDWPVPGDLADPALVRLMPGAGEALAQFHAAGFRIVVITNQGGIARGSYPVAATIATNRRVVEVAGEHAPLAGIYSCPYHPKGPVWPWNREHPWRKPAPGMLLQAAADLGLDLARSWAIGDMSRDLHAAIAAGIAEGRTVLYQGRDPENKPAGAACAADWVEAEERVLSTATL